MLEDLKVYRELAEMRAKRRHAHIARMSADAFSWEDLTASLQRRLAEVELRCLTDMEFPGSREILRGLCAAALGDSEDDGVLFTFEGDDKTERWRLSTATESWTFTVDGADGSRAVPALRGVGGHDHALVIIAVSVLGGSDGE